MLYLSGSRSTNFGESLDNLAYPTPRSSSTISTQRRILLLSITPTRLNESVPVRTVLITPRCYSYLPTLS